MTFSDILHELPKLNPEQREVIINRIEELSFSASPELLAAFSEAEASFRELDISGDEVRAKVREWARSK